MAQAGSVKIFNDDNFNQGISQGIVLVEFYTEWCGHCQKLDPILEEFAKEVAGKITVAKIEAEKSEKTATKFDATSIPVLVLFKDGKELKRVSGPQDINGLRTMTSEGLS